MITLPIGKFEEKILLVQINSLGISLMHNITFSPSLPQTGLKTAISSTLHNY
jgi:hypothetical protein